MSARKRRRGLFCELLGVKRDPKTGPMKALKKMLNSKRYRKAAAGLL